MPVDPMLSQLDAFSYLHALLHGENDAAAAIANRYGGISSRDEGGYFFGSVSGMAVRWYSELEEVLDDCVAPFVAQEMFRALLRQDF